MRKRPCVWLLPLLALSLLSPAFIPDSYAIEGKCVPTPPCFCNPECFRCGPGGCSKPSSPSYEPSGPSAEEVRQQRLQEERRRQQEITDQVAREEAEAKKRQAEFEENKQRALDDLKGVAAGEFGLKDIGDKGPAGTGLKEIGAPVSPTAPLPPQGWSDASVVDLRFLDPTKPIVVDPHIARGKERTFPVQLDPGTYKNVNHNKGLEALLNNKPELAVEYFRKARKERPNDPIMRNMLLLSQDIARVHAQRREEANYCALQTLGAMMSGDPAAARSFADRARNLAPDDGRIASLAAYVKGEGLNWERYLEAQPLQSRNAYRLAGHALYSCVKGDMAAAAKSIDTAHAISPQDPLVSEISDKIHKASAGQQRTGKKDKTRQTEP